MDIIFNKENEKIDRLKGYCGFFKTQEAGLTAMASAMHTPISLMETAGEGGPWGMAVLASYLVNGKGKSLSDYLEQNVFATAKTKTFEASKEDQEGFNRFFANYTKGLDIERAAIANI